MPRDPEYWRKWRASHPEYVERQRERDRRRRAEGRRGDRSGEYARRKARLAALKPQPLEPLFPEIVRGVALEFWDEALDADLVQERALATLEGRDPDEAARQYKAKERAWYVFAAPLWSA